MIFLEGMAMEVDEGSKGSLILNMKKYNNILQQEESYQI